MQIVYPASGLLPPGAHFQNERDDQGHDFATYRKFVTDGIIQAPGSGVCTRIGSDRAFPFGFGPSYPIVRIFDGPYGGHEWYIGHCHARVQVGEHFGFGHVLAAADQGINFNGSRGGWCEFGEAFNGSPGPFSPWHWYDHLILTPLIRIVPDPALHFGDRGPRVSLLTHRLAICGYLPSHQDKFDRRVHGAVVRFKQHHHLPLPKLRRWDRGVVDPRTDVAIQHAAEWCRRHHRHEV